jgi:hypothetical protein
MKHLISTFSVLFGIFALCSSTLADNDPGGGGPTAEQKCMDQCYENSTECNLEAPMEMPEGAAWHLMCQVAFDNCSKTCKKDDTSSRPPNALLLAQAKRMEIMTFSSTSSDRGSACNTAVTVAKSLCGAGLLNNTTSIR